MNTIREWQKAMYEIAKSKGFHENETILNLNVPEKLALIHAEVSEALEAYRDPDMREQGPIFTDLATGKPEGFTVELADAVIRILDLCGAMNLDLEGAMRMKAEYNKTRPYKHGKLF